MNKKRLHINRRFVIVGVLIGVPFALTLALIGLLIMIGGSQIARPIEPTPQPPAIAAPRGEVPAGPVSLSLLARYRGRDDVHAGSGFLLQLSNGERVGVIAAHSINLGNLARPLEQVVFRIPGTSETIAEFHALYGKPGHAMDGVNLAVDYALLQADAPVDPAWVLSPDPRGAPVPGERVSLYSGVGGAPGERYELAGTVMTVDRQAVWVLMDKESFRPGGMSGSPVVSQHTGRVVGMAVAASPRLTGLVPPRYRVLIGLHPIGSIVDKAAQATTFQTFLDVHRGQP